MNNKIGIDAGGSLIKIAYEENGRLHFRKQPNSKLDDALQWLKITATNKPIYLTGGKAGTIKANYFPEAKMVDEFSAVCEGSRHLKMKEVRSASDSYILVNIGTGTSWFTINGEQYDRVLGSGIGGGTFMGLGEILAETEDFSELVSLAAAGDKGNVDLLVKDIYHPEKPPIHGDLTASNFAKSQEITPSSPADKIASLNNMIAETLTLLTVQAANLHNIKQVVFIGSTLAGNTPLREHLKSYCSMSGIDPVYLENGEFSGAIGAMLTK
ncbi:type II pantothenate kinase [Bacillus sp. ISL-35]|uniref:type II pantothenate kinase n=1 Tax=Bacillus sp. ISL-35 TaxID=2819122 RepID=UPI001BECF719|nr:type II pantothenate kinase [Bacillus sp. ISL-35]MBT2679519.1 type II pantothenate kinase [Bacillus sp. ISL-35]MBT2703422.1 type II pantothenate kinase [Chryseobacterium sp. ISL-80]